MVAQFAPSADSDYRVSVRVGAAGAADDDENNHSGLLRTTLLDDECRAGAGQVQIVPAQSTGTGRGCFGARGSATSGGGRAAAEIDRHEVTLSRASFLLWTIPIPTIKPEDHRSYWVSGIIGCSYNLLEINLL